MKERLEIAIDNLLEEKMQLRKEIQEISWSMKYASLMTLNGKERKDKLVERFKQVNEEIKRLEWILEGEE